MGVLDNLNLNLFIKRATNSLDKKNSQTIEKNNNPELMTASSPKEALKNNLENQIVNKFKKQSLQIGKGQDQRQLMYEASRLTLYYDYLSMDGYPTLGAALDLLAEEATTIKSDTGKVLNIYASNETVRNELERLFYKVLDIDTVAFQWTRDMAQFGDKFVFLEIEKDLGVTGVRSLASQFVERNEKYDKNNRFRAYFKYKDPYSGSEDEYIDIQVAHFRLLGSGDRLPYGTSVFEKVRRTFKQLFMMEDAMMVYRITRAPERRVYRIPVGNTPPEDIPMMIQQYAANLKNKHLVDPKTGDINWKYNIASMDEDIFMPDNGSSSGNVIDTLQGASNLDQIGDLNYLRDNLFVGLGIHKSLLGFSSDSSAGDGKNLSMLDIRFARKVNRIQQALLAELNKIAIIHLSTLGGDYAAYIDDFKLTLNNPSTASDLLQLEIWKSKLDVYAQATTPNQATQIKPMSELMAKKLFFKMSEEDIINDLQEQMLEFKVGEELKASGMLIKSSGIMDKMIKYKNSGFNFKNNENNDQQQGEQPMDQFGGLGGFNPSPSGPDLMGNTMPNASPDLGTSTPMNSQQSNVPGASGFLAESLINKSNDLLDEFNEEKN
jgi:hypothetical protein